MTATLNGMFSSAPDTPSPVYPDRLIRPLPKRPLRSRLSSEAADSILYPPAPPATQLLYGASATNGDIVNESKVYVQQSVGRELSPDRDHHISYENGVDLDSGDEDGPVVVRRSAGFRRSSLSPMTSGVHHPKLPSSGKEQPIKPSPAGPDGYDAFENTNNKKKRKIPTPGNMGSHHSSLSPEFATMGLANSAQNPSAPSVEGGHVSTFYGTGSPASPIGNGISGSGRGRLGRQGRRSSVHGHGGWSQGRNSGRWDGPLSSPGPNGESAARNQGIISAAIANAAASTLSSSPYRASIQGSMLEKQTTPTKTQFTFTCKSDSSKGMAMQAQSLYSPQHRSPVTHSSTAHNSRFSTQGTQTSPTASSQPNHHTSSQQQQQSYQPAAPAELATTERKKKRSPGSIYALAARQRKIQQQYANLHHPPSLEDIWICEFCEYESIFGHPPVALIRQYEIKDRKERKRLAEKKRLLEKAKMKGRKHKKATKNAAKHATAQHAAYDHSYDRASADRSSLPGGGPHDDEYLEPEHDNEAPAAVPPPTPAGTFKPPHPPGSAAKKLLLMWFVLFKIFRFGYSETKKYKAKKQQQQQQEAAYGAPQFQQPPHPNPYFYNPPPGDTSRAAGGPAPGYGPDSYNMDPLPAQTPPASATLSKRAKAKDLAALLLALAQFAFGLAVIGLYSQDINAARDNGDSAPSRWVYAVVTGFLSMSSAFCYLLLGWWWKKRSKPAFSARQGLFLPLFVWEGVLIILWLVVFGIFGEMYIGVYHVGGKDGGENKVTRMRRAVWVDLACLVFWAVSAVWKGLRWWKAKGRSDAGEGDGLGPEKEMA
ncbi:MARVEL domain-containing protein [Aspergillus lucknowensis]|uniref:Uncharacterized protein n=1 Tax=Aspergillus lucknowensis TaxID=176173 RepID=A0ABR4LWH0_9EURO